ncbi:MAG TPA: VanZ family protein [Candidatus Sulfomarinibacteraceae bacterium]|nr:VanZ family protein [Candidatus Sulfomarinibacteraceae bacterium]
MATATRRWLAVSVWIAVIYTAIPFVRALREWFVGRWDEALIAWAVAAALVAAAALAVALARRAPALRPGGLLWIAGVTAILLLWTYHLRHRPEEAVHFLQYGVLALLLFRALRPIVPDATVFLAGAIAGSLVGTADEVIQWLTPSRFWDWRDVVINAAAGALVQLALWRALPPSGVPPSVGSLRLVLRLAMAQLLLLGLCLANTPARVAVWAPALGLPHLTSSVNPMAEYGHRHEIPGLGAFNSRLGLAELEAEDRARAAEVAAVLDDTRHSYGRFLDTWPAAEDPFTYEARVHLFSRDRNLAEARQAGFAGAAAHRAATVAWFENALLERHFGRTLAASSYPWSPEQRARVEAAREPGRRLVSAAGSHLITVASEARLRALLVAALALLAVADLSLGRYHRGRP